MPNQDFDLGAQLEDASRIEDPTRRLEAYDSIVQSYELSSQDMISVTTSKWTGSSNTDPLDDSRTVMLMLDSDSGNDASGDPVSLVLRFDGKKSEVYVNWNTDLGSTASVTMRVGTELAETMEWAQSKARKATFYPKDSIELIRKLKDADRFIAKVKPPNGDPIVAIFDVRGLAQTISKYANDLRW